MKKEELLTCSPTSWPTVSDLRTSGPRPGSSGRWVSARTSSPIWSTRCGARKCPSRAVRADTARAYKLHREIFIDALRIRGCALDEVVHTGDSKGTGEVGVRGTGIRPVLLLRGHGRQHDDVDVADGLEQASELVFKKG